MTAVARLQSQDVVWSRLLERLAGTQPVHEAALSRIGAGLADAVDPRLHALIPPALRPAAVLVGMQNLPEPGFLLTVRAGHLRTHPGQIAFPGGAIDPVDESPAAAALREAWEEVGLLPADAQVVGYLPDQIVFTGFRITPVIAQITDNFVPRIDTAEVESCFMLPLAALLEKENERPTTRSIGGIEVQVRDLQFGPHRIWGATAGILFALRTLALQ